MFEGFPMRRNYILGGLFGLSLSLSALGFVLSNPKDVKAEKSIEVVESTFFIRGIQNSSAEPTSAYIDVCLPNFDYTGTDETIAGIYNEAQLERYKKINFFNYITINGLTVPDWGQTNEDGVSMSFYNVVNMTDCKYDIRFRVSVPSGYVVNQVGLKKGFQLPSYGYLTQDETNEWKVYEARADEYAIKADVAWGWKTIIDTNVEEMAYVQKPDAGYGYVGISLTGDDYEGEQLEKNGNNSYRYNYQSKVYANNDTETHPFKDYGLFSLSPKGPGMFAVQTQLSEEELQKVTIPEETLFPARISTEMMTPNSGIYPVVYFKTTEERNFVKVDDEYVCQETLAAAKEAAKSELEEYASPDDYLPAQQSILASTIEEGKEAIDAAASEGQIAQILERYKAVIDGIPDKETIEEFNSRKEEYKTELANYKKDVVYREAQAQERARIISEASSDIDAAESLGIVEEIVVEAKALIDLLPTAEELNAIDQYRDGKKEEVRAYKADVEYGKAKTQKDQAMQKALDDLDATNDTSDMDEIVTQYKEYVDTLPTKAEEDAEALEVHKREVIAQLNIYSASFSVEDYSENDWKTITNLISSARSDIEKATSMEEVDRVFANLKAEVSAISKKEDAKPSSSRGCGGALAGTSIAVSLMALAAGATLFARRKRK